MASKYRVLIGGTSKYHVFGDVEWYPTRDDMPSLPTDFVLMAEDTKKLPEGTKNVLVMNVEPQTSPTPQRPPWVPADCTCLMIYCGNGKSVTAEYASFTLSSALKQHQQNGLDHGTTWNTTQEIMWNYFAATRPDPEPKTDPPCTKIHIYDSDYPLLAPDEPTYQVYRFGTDVPTVIKFGIFRKEPDFQMFSAGGNRTLYCEIPLLVVAPPEDGRPDYCPHNFDVLLVRPARECQILECVLKYVRGEQGGDFRYIKAEPVHHRVISPRTCDDKFFYAGVKWETLGSSGPRSQVDYLHFVEGGVEEMLFPGTIYAPVVYASGASVEPSCSGRIPRDRACLAVACETWNRDALSAAITARAANPHLEEGSAEYLVRGDREKLPRLVLWRYFPALEKMTYILDHHAPPHPQPLVVQPGIGWARRLPEGIEPDYQCFYEDEELPPTRVILLIEKDGEPVRSPTLPSTHDFFIVGYDHACPRSIESTAKCIKEWQKTKFGTMRGSPSGTPIKWAFCPRPSNLTQPSVPQPASEEERRLQWFNEFIQTNRPEMGPVERRLAAKMFDAFFTTHVGDAWEAVKVAYGLVGQKAPPTPLPWNQ